MLRDRNDNGGPGVRFVADGSLRVRGSAGALPSRTALHDARRRNLFFTVALAAVGLAVASGCGSALEERGSTPPDRVLVIGMDGMDPVLVQQLMDAGKLPHFERLAALGEFRSLATSMPPQSPVAWSNVICGCHPGVHEIYDFIHRDPDPGIPGMAIRPYLSTSTVEPPGSERQIALGKWRIPLASETLKLERRGPTFWQYLAGQGVDTTIYRMPANYPVLDVSGRGVFQCLAGMGTPDLLGSYGEFTLFTPDAPAAGRQESGGRIVPLHPDGHRAESAIPGPENFLRAPESRGPAPHMTAPFVVVRDPQRSLVKLTMGGQLMILKEGEWSPWIQFDFETGLPGSSIVGPLGAPTSIPGMVRFYVKQVHPKLILFATPVNIDPTRPANPISVPGEFAGQLAEATGLYFTTGIPQHAPEVQRDALSEDEWLEKVHIILDERVGQFRYALKQFESGCLFFYFGAPDLVQHIFWRDQDPDHPGRNAEDGDRYATVIEDMYVRMDGLVGEALEVLKDNDTLMVMSDHGFASFRRGFNLNTWLVDNGYIELRDSSRRASDRLFFGVNWRNTQAYGLGLNGLYINVRGREKYGSVSDGKEKARLLSEISAKLLAIRDDDGSQVVAKTYIVSEIYPDADPQVAPDMLVGYARNYRAGWSTLLGGITTTLIDDNHDRWSGDHCIAADLVPGILLCNRKITVEDPQLTDIGPTILNLLGVPVPAEMQGRPIVP